MITDELRRIRLDVITEHMDTEVSKEFDRTLATFNGHPRYGPANATGTAWTWSC